MDYNNDHLRLIANPYRLKKNEQKVNKKNDIFKKNIDLVLHNEFPDIYLPDHLINKIVYDIHLTIHNHTIDLLVDNIITNAIKNAITNTINTTINFQI